MIITDSQVHIWLPESVDRPWIPGARMYLESVHGGPALDSLLADDMIRMMDEAGVARAVLVPPSFEGDRNDQCQAAALAYPERFAVMGRCALDDPFEAAVVRSWRDMPAMLGARLTFHRGPSIHWLDEGVGEWFWDLAEELGLAAYVYPPGQLPLIADVARRHPGMRFVIDHLALETSLKDDEIIPHVEALLPLADEPNIAVKASGLIGSTSSPFPYAPLHAPISAVIDAFGIRRVFFGSDATRIPGTYLQAVEMFTRGFDFLSADDLEWIMGRGLSDWLNWPSASAEQ